MMNDGMRAKRGHEGKVRFEPLERGRVMDSRSCGLWSVVLYCWGLLRIPRESLCSLLPSHAHAVCRVGEAYSPDHLAKCESHCQALPICVRRASRTLLTGPRARTRYAIVHVHVLSSRRRCLDVWTWTGALGPAGPRLRASSPARESGRPVPTANGWFMRRGASIVIS